MAETFNFCPNSLVPKTTAPEEVSGMSLGGWQFTSRPTVPYQKRFKVKLHGMRWYTDSVTGLYDSATDPTHNARALELFYEAHRKWRPFYWTHPHLGLLTVKFDSAVDVAPAIENSGGLCDVVEISLVHDNPGY